MKKDVGAYYFKKQLKVLIYKYISFYFTFKSFFLEKVKQLIRYVCEILLTIILQVGLRCQYFKDCYFKLKNVTQQFCTRLSMLTAVVL